jgi:hypothetical protein
MSMPFWDVGGFATRPIDDSNVIYEYHFYYDYPMDPDSTSQLCYDMSQAYGEGRLTEAKTFLTQYLNWKLSGLPKDRVNIGELGVLGMTGVEPSDPNWDAFMQDAYDYIEQQQLAGLFQYAIARTRYNMFDPATDYTTYTPYGALWAQNCPT